MKTEVSFKELRQLRDAIESELNGSVYVDIRSDSLAKIVFEHKKLFVIRQTKIEITPLATKIFRSERTKKHIDEFYNWRMPIKIKQSYMAILSKDGEK